jgi:hypothetical protein
MYFLNFIFELCLSLWMYRELLSINIAKIKIKIKSKKSDVKSYSCFLLLTFLYLYVAQPLFIRSFYNFDVKLFPTSFFKSLHMLENHTLFLGGTRYLLIPLYSDFTINYMSADYI